MSKEFKLVATFNEEILGIAPRPLGPLSDEELRISFLSLHEEADEFGEAMGEDDMVGAIDACIDNIYFAMGILYKLGIDDATYSQIFEAVNMANMTKRLGINDKRDTGAADAIKPEGWIAPEERIAEIIKTLGTKH